MKGWRRPGPQEERKKHWGSEGICCISRKNSKKGGGEKEKGLVKRRNIYKSKHVYRVGTLKTCS